MSHSFPSLDHSAIGKPGDSAEGCDIFKPLYKEACFTEDLPSPQAQGSSVVEETRDAEERSVQIGFKRGFEAGRQDACTLARQEIIPEIESFALALQQLNASLHRIEDLSCDKMLKMALSAAEKVLGMAPNIGTQALEGFRTELKQFLTRSYQLNLTFNGQDMDTISEYVREQIPHWQDGDHIKMDSQDQLAANGLHAEPGGHLIDSEDTLGPLMQSLENILGVPSTK